MEEYKAEDASDVEDKQYPQDDVGWWLRWLESAKKGAYDVHKKRADSAWAEYEKESLSNLSGLVENTDTGVDRSDSTYWYSVKVLEAGYFSRIPQLVTRREWGVPDQVAQTGQIIVERLGKHLVDQCDFFEAAQTSVLDFIHASKAAQQVCYSEETVTEEVEVPQPDGSFVIEEVERIEKNIEVKAARYFEVLHNPDARTQNEIREEAFHFRMPRSEAEEFFGKDICKHVTWKKLSSDDKEKDRENDESSLDTEFLEGYECYCKESKMVYWVSRQYPSDFLKKEADWYELKDFFPCTRWIIGNRPKNSLFPVPTFTQLKYLIDEIHKATEKVSDLIVDIERRALVDGADEELLLALNNTGSGTYVAHTNLSKIVEKGGLQNSIYWIPLQELVQALGELNELKDRFSNEYFQKFGLSDIMRGITDPAETKGAQQMAAAASHDRFKADKKQIAAMLRESIQMMIDLALYKFSDEEIAEIVGLALLDSEDQQYFLPALQFLRNDKGRNIRIDIDTDTMSYLDATIKQAEVAQASQIAVNGLKDIAQMMQISPQVAAVGLKAILMTLESMNYGKELQDDVVEAVQKLLDDMMQAEGQAQQAPPDYEGMKLQLEAQKQQLEAQKMQQAAMKDQVELQLAGREQVRKEAETAGDQQLDAMAQKLDELVETTKLQLDAQRVEIERYKAQAQALESRMEEIRMAKLADIDEAKAVIEAANVAKEEPSPTTINIG